MAILLDRDGLDGLLLLLADQGFTVVGPTVRDRAIVYDEISSSDDLPHGWADEQDGGTYRLRRRDDDALFGYAVGPHSWKRFLFPPSELLWRARRSDDGFATEQPVEQRRYAFIGVRACELAAIDVQDRTFMGAYRDAAYAARREDAFLVAVNCSDPAGTCFCVSMGTGPGVTSGYDVCLTELPTGELVAEHGTDAGAQVLAALPQRPAAQHHEDEARRVVERSARHMGRAMDIDGIKELLYSNQEHPRWDEVASRCLSCTNCTLVCPTCFCFAVEDASDLAGGTAERTRRWDSCFNLEHSYVHGGSVRASARSRYRQWMTHKLASWIDQFGTSGCVGCGRCITWCPVGIDLTEEAAAIRATEVDRADA